MKQKILPAMLTACLVSSITVDAYAAIGRSGGGSRPSFSRSVSAPKAPSAPYSKPAASPAPARPGGIGGTTGSVGVRKPEVTQQVANKVNPPTSTSSNTTQSRPAYAPTNPATTPAYSQPASNVTNGSTFMSSLGGAFVGSALGNMIFGNHGSTGSTTVINNGTGGSATPAATTTSGPSAGPSAGPTNYVDSNGVVTSQQYQPQPYGLWGFIKDVFLFGVLVLLIGGIGFVFYQGFKKLKAYWNRERGIAPVQPVNPTQMFWRIQQMHAEGSVSGLTELLGPDVLDELTHNLQPYTLLITQVSHEVVRSNAREFSVHYTFYEDSTKLDQVWHYELINGSWKLNGIENIEAC